MSFHQLPSGYKLVKTIDMKKDRNLGVLLNIVASIGFVVVLALAYLIKPFPYGTDLQIHHFFVIVGGLVVYIVAHELVHALFMRLFIKQRVNFGIHIWAAYAGVKDGYFTKREYFVIGLAPVTLLGLLLTGLLIYVTNSTLVASNWYWPLIMIQGQNIVGAIGDYFVVYHLLRAKPEVLVNDDGMSMRFYEQNSDEQSSVKSTRDDTDFI
jgi:hypothetical protein